MARKKRSIQVGGCYVAIGVVFDEGMEKFQLARKHLRAVRTIMRRSSVFDEIAKDVEEADRHLGDIAGAQGLGGDLDIPEEM